VARAAAVPALHSFPTRRSSDLEHRGGLVAHAGVPAIPGEGALAAVRRHLQHWGTTGREHFDRDLALARAGAHQGPLADPLRDLRSEEHTSELQSRENLVCRLPL